MRLATRGSALAQWQANEVAALLSAAGVADVELVIVETAGDRDTTSPLHAIGGKGVFCKEVQAAVLDGRADLAVHSAKDLPSITPPGLVIAAVPERGEPRDALVGSTLLDLHHGARVATGSVRRRAQLRRLRPDLEFSELRGNIETRLAKANQFDAIVMAGAALERLGLRPDCVDLLPVETLVPQVGQGALAIECRIDDDATRAALALIDDPETALVVQAERAFLGELGGDCSLPAGAHARRAGDGSVELIGFLASPDLATSRQLRASAPTGGSAAAIGAGVAATLRDEIERR